LNQEADGPMRHELVIPERDNVRLALEWALSAGEAQLGLRLALALENFWITSDPLEGKRWIDALLVQAPNLDPWLHAFALRLLGNFAAITGDIARAVELYGQSLDEFRECGDELRVAIAQHRLAVHLLSLGQTERARALVGESLAYFQRVAFAKGEAQCHGFLGRLAWKHGDHERALEHYDRSIALLRETGFTWAEIRGLLARAEKLFELSRTTEAADSAREALEAARRIHDRIGTVEGLAFLARAAVEREEEELAGRLWGAIEADIERAPLPIWEVEGDELAEPVLARAGAPFEAGRAEGRSLALEEAAQLALDLKDDAA
jgi:tetratricopeptide (TPR) repeat protein